LVCACNYLVINTLQAQIKVYATEFNNIYCIKLVYITLQLNTIHGKIMV
jgi:hypothetical protein